jgi:hypothetical protein
MYLETQISFEGSTFEAFFESDQEACSIRAIDYAVIVRKAEVDHGTDCNCLATVFTLDDHWTLYNCAEPENCNLWLINDRSIEECTT